MLFFSPKSRTFDINLSTFVVHFILLFIYFNEIKLAAQQSYIGRLGGWGEGVHIAPRLVPATGGLKTRQDGEYTLFSHFRVIQSYFLFVFCATSQISV